MKKQTKLKEREKANKGITLIALVITIIVLLILVAISIATLTGENGILTKAGTAKTDTKRAEIIENARIDILAKQAENLGSLTEEELAEILTTKYGTLSDNEEESILDKILTSKDGEHEIQVKEIWNGEFYKESVKLINFTINGISFTANEGETWKQWLDRKYNPDSRTMEGMDAIMSDTFITMRDYGSNEWNSELSFWISPAGGASLRDESKETIKVVSGTEQIKDGGIYDLN